MYALPDPAYTHHAPSARLQATSSRLPSSPVNLSNPIRHNVPECATPKERVRRATRRPAWTRSYLRNEPIIRVYAWLTPLPSCPLVVLRAPPPSRPLRVIAPSRLPPPRRNEPTTPLPLRGLRASAVHPPPCKIRADSRTHQIYQTNPFRPGSHPGFYKDVTRTDSRRGKDAKRTRFGRGFLSPSCPTRSATPAASSPSAKPRPAHFLLSVQPTARNDQSSVLLPLPRFIRVNPSSLPLTTYAPSSPSSSPNTAGYAPPAPPLPAPLRRPEARTPRSRKSSSDCSS